jgi:hypothetical protein
MVKKIIIGLAATLVILVIGFIAIVYIRQDRIYPSFTASTDSAIIKREINC